MSRTSNDALHATYLNDLRKQRMTVMVYLVNGMKQIGLIKSFDQHSLLMRQMTSVQLLYKQMIASVIPAPKALGAQPTRSAQRPAARSEPNAVPVIVRKVSRRTIVRDE
jgi:host factor-I protein